MLLVVDVIVSVVVSGAVAVNDPTLMYLATSYNQFIASRLMRSFCKRKTARVPR